MASLNKSGSSEGRSGSGRKRQYTRPNGDEGDRPKKRRGSSKVPTSSGANNRGFACPYNKKDPLGHLKCAEHSFTRISDVKSHIFKCHIQPEYCTLCGATFKDGQSRDNHIAVTHPGQHPDRIHDEPDGVDPKRERDLRQRQSSRLTVADKWFAIFDIACPGHPRPPSPYHEPEMCPCCAKISDLRGFATGNSDTETFSKSLRQSSGWRPESEALLREGLNHWLGDPSDQCVKLQNDVPEEVIGEDAPEASSDSISNCFHSSEPVPSNCLDNRHIRGSASSIASAQPTAEAREDASYASGVPQISTSLQASGMSHIPSQGSLPDLYSASLTTPNLDALTDFVHSFDDFSAFALPGEFVNDGGNDPSTHGYGR